MVSTIRRSVGAFLLALVVAAGLVLTPAPVQAQDNSLYCAILKNALEFWASKPNAPQGVVDKLQALYDTYCVTVTAQ